MSHPQNLRREKLKCDQVLREVLYHRHIAIAIGIGCCYRRVYRAKSRTSAALAVFFVPREHWTPTWTGGLLTPAVVAMLTVILARGLRGFLAITSPVGGQFLVVEGWMPTYA